MKLVQVLGGLTHLVDPRTVNGLACNAGRSGRSKAPRRIVHWEYPSCGRCAAMLDAGTHPNLTTARA